MPSAGSPASSTVEDVLQLIVDRVRALVGARYAALGILAEDRFGSSGSSRAASPRSSAAAGRSAAGPRPPGADHQGGAVAPDPRHPGPSGQLWVPGEPSADDVPARRPGPAEEPDRSATSTSPTRSTPAEFSDDDQRLVELFAAPRRRRDRERPTPRGSPASRRRRRARPDRQGPPRRDHPVALRDLPVARGRAGDDGRDRDEADGPRRSRDRQPERSHRGPPALRRRVASRARRPQRISSGCWPCLPTRSDATASSTVDLDLPAERVDLPAHIRGELLQIAREALSNSARHARASTARVSLRREARRAAPRARRRRVRLRSIASAHQWATTVSPTCATGPTALGGSIRSRSNEPGGTTIIVMVPLAVARQGRRATTGFDT